MLFSHLPSGDCPPSNSLLPIRDRADSIAFFSAIIASLFRLALLLAFLLAVTVASGDEGAGTSVVKPTSEETNALESLGDGSGEARFLIRAMAEERAKIRSGECAVAATEWASVIENSNESGVSSTGERITAMGIRLNSVCRFDGARKRIDTKAEPIDDSITPGVLAATDEPYFEGHIAYLPEKLIYWGRDNKYVAFFPPGSAFTPQMRVFDLRGIGLFTDVGLENEGTLPKAVADLESWRYKSASTESSGARILELCSNDPDADGTLCYKLTILPHQGFTPVVGQMTEMIDGRPEILCAHKTEWAEMGDAWVPVSHRLESTPLGMNEKSNYQYEFSWSKVNEPMDSKVFTYENFGIPGRYGVIDKTAAVARIVKPFEDTIPVKERSNWPPMRVAMLLINGCLLVAVAFLAIYRAFRSKR